MEEKKTADMRASKDKVAIISFVLGILSIPFAFVGVVPIAAIIFGVWGINRTKSNGTGRWMAVTGLVLGAVFLLANAYTNGHLGFLTQSTVNNTPQLQQQTTNFVTGALGDDLLTSTGYTIRISNMELDLTDSQGPLRNELVPNKIYGKFDVTVINTTQQDIKLYNSEFSNKSFYKIEDSNGFKNSVVVVGNEDPIDYSVLSDNNPFGQRLLNQIKDRIPVTGELTPGGKVSSQVIFTIDEDATGTVKLHFDKFVIDLK